MKRAAKKLLKYFDDNHGVATFASIRKSKFHPDSLRELEAEGEVIKIVRGIYKKKTNTMGPYPDLVLASLQSPNAVVCLISALSFHEATTEIPAKIDLAIKNDGSRSNRIAYPPVKFHRFSEKTWGTGIEIHSFIGQKIKIYSLAKTVADCFKFRSQIGMDLARQALITAVMEKGIKPQEIIRFARICRVERLIKPLLEVLM